MESPSQENGEKEDASPSEERNRSSAMHCVMESSQEKDEKEESASPLHERNVSSDNFSIPPLDDGQDNSTDDPNSKQVRDHVRQHIRVVEACIASMRGSTEASSTQESRSMRGMLRKMKTLYTGSLRSSSIYRRKSNQINSTLQMIEALRGLGFCLREVYDNEDDPANDANSTRDIVEDVAAIPYLIKTILLMDDEGVRREILSLPILRRVMLCKYSVHPDDSSLTNQTESSRGSPSRSSSSWLVNMFKDASTKERGVDYLEIISNLTISDYMCLPVQGHEFGVISPIPTKKDIEEFNQVRMELFQSVASNERLTPKLFTLSKREMERASVTAAVRWALNDEIRRPFMITIVFCDFIFHAVLLILYRWVVFYFHSNFEEPSRIATSIVFFCMCYFLFRLLVDLALIWVSWNMFWRNLFYRWTIIETCSTIMVWISFVALFSRSFGTDFETTGRAYYVFQAVTIALLWLKLLGFLQVMNRTLAAYIFAIFEVGRLMLLLTCCSHEQHQCL